MALAEQIGSNPHRRMSAKTKAAPEGSLHYQIDRFGYSSFLRMASFTSPTAS